MKTTKIQRDFFAICLTFWLKNIAPVYRGELCAIDETIPGDIATSHVSPEDMLESIALSDKLGGRSNECLFRDAFHEVCHATLSPLAAPMYPVYSEQFINQRTHMIINMLERFFFETLQIHTVDYGFNHAILEAMRKD